MTKDNILYSIIGLLLGVIAGYVFATTVNQHGFAPRVAANNATGPVTQDSRLHDNKQSSLGDNSASQDGASADNTAAIEQAKAQPDNFDAQMQAGAKLYQDHQIDEAITYFTRANQLRPDSYEAIVALGNTSFDMDRYETAEKWYTAALAKKPDDVNVRTDLGLTFLFREPMDADRAIKEFRRSLEINPNHEQTLQNLTVALIKKGSLDEADTTLKKLAEVNPSSPGLTKLRAELNSARASGKTAASGQ